MLGLLPDVTRIPSVEFPTIVLYCIVPGCVTPAKSIPQEELLYIQLLFIYGTPEPLEKIPFELCLILLFVISGEALMQ